MQYVSQIVHFPLTDDSQSTEAFSPGFVEARVAEESAEEQPVDLDWDKLQLNSIIPTDSNCRVIVLPTVDGISFSPHGGTSGFNSWVEVNIGEAPEKTARLLTIAPNREQVGFTVRYNDVRCVVYFDPSEDRLLLENEGLSPIFVTRRDDSSVTEVGYQGVTTLVPGVWAVSRDICLVELNVLESFAWRVSASSHTKRAAEDDGMITKKTRLSNQVAAVRTRALQAVSPGNALLRLQDGEIIHVGASDSGYKLKRLKIIANQRNSSVWRGEHSEMPSKEIVIKIIKTSGVSPKDAIKAAQSWMHELTIHSSLEDHPAVLRLLGSDARFHSIYTEHVDARALISCSNPDGSFRGDATEQWRILSDVVSALSFVHGNNIVHNDVKLANILYSPTRGAVLIDFGLSFVDGHALRGGGTPWYLPPEYATNVTARGKTSDIWALGVVMLWVLRYMVPFPEREREWSIADLHAPKISEARRREALGCMRNWTNRVRSLVPALTEGDDQLESIVKGTLELDPDNRSDADSLLQAIATSQKLQRA
ncbi:kinase-like domain-containing protein [Xylariaceae sp. FL1019]|nr:kinase-like domain-containing protein [Xylariaceae sp. FL1019]